MTESPSQKDESALPPAHESLAVMFAAVFCGNALGAASIVGLVGVGMHLPARSLVMPFLALLPAGAALAPWIHWARLTRQRPKASALRFAIGFSVWVVLFAAGCEFAAAWVGIGWPGRTLFDILGTPVLCLLLSAPMSYFLTLRNLEGALRASHASRSEGIKGGLGAAINESPSRKDESASRPTGQSFGVMLAAVCGGNALVAAAVVGLVGYGLHLPARSMVLPFLALLPSGVALALWIHSARLTEQRPNASALRFAIGFFSYVVILSAGGLFGAVWAGILSPQPVLYDIFPTLVDFCVLLSVGTYFLIRQHLKGAQQQINSV